MSIIVGISGGKASAWCADWALKNYPKDDVVLYFNDTKWEHPDLYRFLNELSIYWGKEITNDSDSRNPEQLFYDKHAIANNRMPFCSHILKADRLQKFYKDGDTLIFGIGIDEMQRTRRLIEVYQLIAAKTGKFPTLRFPLVENNVTAQQVNEWLQSIGIQEPLLYRLGFKHNNCSGGCVRAGKKHWKLLYEKLPEVYAERERVEREISKHFNKSMTIFKDETLEHFRERIINGELSSYYDTAEYTEVECIGICDSMN